MRVVLNPCHNIWGNEKCVYGLFHASIIASDALCAHQIYQISIGLLKDTTEDTIHIFCVILIVKTLPNLLFAQFLTKLFVCQKVLKIE